MVLELKTENFDEGIRDGDKPVLVDFWADWCGPCRMVSPIVDQIGEEHSDKVKVCKLNVDQSQEIAAKYGIMSIPTLILFENGEPKTQLVGVQSKERIEEMVGI